LVLQENILIDLIVCIKSLVFAVRELLLEEICMSRKKDGNIEPLLLRINPADNVEVVVNTNGLKAGMRISDGLKIKEFIPQGHKLSIRDLRKGEEIIKYGQVIGYAIDDIPKGSWVNEDNVVLPEPPSLENLTFATELENLPLLEGETFLGYRNSDGSIGTKNMLGLLSCVQCVEGVMNVVVNEIKEELLPQYPYVDGIVPINHNYGCGVAIDAPEAEIPIRTLRNLASNPNLGELIIISLGCEKLAPTKLFEGMNESANVILLQDECGFESMKKKIATKAKEALERLNKRRREICPASGLIVGLQCGGSDAFSGITANPAVGYAADLLVRSGATVVFSEVSEVRDGLHLLSPRIINSRVAEKLKEEIAWYDRYLSQGKVDRDANPTPGNKQGGLANVVEKSLGSIEKSGTTPIVDVLSPGEKVRKKGLVFAATPASDFVCGTLQLAAGVTVQVFTTGRGTPYGLAMAPVIKVCSRTELKDKWNDLIDIDAGRILTGEVTFEELGKEIFQFILDVCSGKKKTWSDYWGIENRMCLFNPAPIT
jgi:galactarate dehydratase